MRLGRGSIHQYRTSHGDDPTGNSREKEKERIQTEGVHSVKCTTREPVARNEARGAAVGPPIYVCISMFRYKSKYQYTVVAIVEW